MTLRSSVSIWSAHARASASGLAREPEQQRFERLAGAVDSEVGLRRRGQQAAQRIERLGADRGPVDGVGIGRVLRIARGEVLLHRPDPFRVALERAVHRARVSIPQRAAWDLGRDVIPPAAVQPVGVRHVARGLLEVGHQASPLEQLGQHVRDVLAGDVRAAQLRDRVVAVLVEDLGEELLGSSRRRRSRPRPGLARPVASVLRLPDLVGELVQEEPSQRFRRSRVSREERALDGLGQVGQREDVPVEIREVWGEPHTLVGGERLGDGVGGNTW